MVWKPCAGQRMGVLSDHRERLHSNHVPSRISQCAARAGHHRASAEATQSHLHEFWADDISLLDGQHVDAARIHGPRQLTDLYLFALALRHGGRFATFDQAIATNAIKGAKAKDLVVL